MGQGRLDQRVLGETPVAYLLGGNTWVHNQWFSLGELCIRDLVYVNFGAIGQEKRAYMERHRRWLAVIDWFAHQFGLQKNGSPDAVAGAGERLLLSQRGGHDSGPEKLHDVHQAVSPLVPQRPHSEGSLGCVLGYLHACMN